MTCLFHTALSILDALDDEISDVQSRVEDLKSQTLVEEGANPRVEQRIEAIEAGLKHVEELRQGLPYKAGQELHKIECALNNRTSAQRVQESQEKNKVTTQLIFVVTHAK